MFFQFRKKYKSNRYILWLSRALIILCTVVVLIRSYPILNIFAVDTTYTWLFPNNTDYTLSDSSKVEVASNVTRLKVQENSTDASTGMLLHLNEASGNPVDSASPANTATATNLTYGAGKLNNGATFNGTTSKVSVADSSGISLNNSHTIETWANLGSSLTANSGYTRQPIFDKGSQQMYFDQGTGELVYEAALSNQTDWAHVAGPISSDTPGSDFENADGTVTDTWDYNGKAVVSAMVHIGSNLYVGLGAEYSDAEVWKFNGTTWSKIGGDKLRSSWINQKYEIVSAMAANGNTLYVGIGSTNLSNDGDGEVWSLDVSNDANTWTKIGGDGTNSSWNYAVTTQGPFEIVNVLHYASGALYAGIGGTAAANNTDAEVWRFNGSTWTKVGGDSNQSGYGWSTAVLYENVLAITSDATYLYVGMSLTAGDADVWRATLASLAGTPSWTQIGGDNLNSGWNTGFEEVRMLYAQGSYVYAGLGSSAAGDAEVYRWNGSAWTKIGECPSTSSCTTQGWANNVYEQIWSIWGDGTYTYYGMGNTAGDNDVWRFNDNGTDSTADDVWLQIATAATATDIGNNHTAARVLYHDGTSLYVGLHAPNNFTGEVWRWNGSANNWTIIGGNYVNDSWGFYPFSRVESMVTGNGKLYVGMGATSSGKYGSAVVWQHDGTSWTRIGGGGKNGSWTGTFSPLTAYETINSMVMYAGKLYVGLGFSAGDAEVWGWEVVTPNTWTKVGGDGGVPVAVASSGTGNRAASANNDGITSWTARTSAADTSWSGVVYGNDQYVAVSSSGVIQSVMTSPDGTTWTIRDAATANAWQSVTFGEGLFVAVASSGTGDRVMTSPDGIAWTTRTSAADVDWKSVTYGNGMFVAVANTGTGNRVMTSPDGIAWTIQSSASDISWNSVTYGNGVFVAVANDGILASVMTSTNGTSWSIQNASVANAWQGVTFGRGVFVAIASSGTSNRAMSSTDGAAWTTKTTPVAANSYNWSSITFNHSYNNTGRFVAIANGGAGTTQRVMYGTLNTATTDTVWTIQNFNTTNSWNAITNNTSWSAATNIEVVQSMTVHECPGVTTMCMYVGLGNTANTDSKVYAYDSSTWQQVGGYGTVGSWEGLNIEIINSLISYNGKLYAAIGNTAPAANNGDGELWEYSGNGTAWTKVGGDGVNSSWNYTGATAYGPYESVNATVVYAGDLYVGLGNSADGSAFADSEVWKWSGSGSWTKVGGDGLNSSWDNSQNYEAVRSMAVYNGELYVGLGDTAGVGVVDSEVWKWNGSAWTIVGGEAANNSSWPDTVTPLKEQVYSLANYNGRLYAGLGNGVGDAAIWAYGRNAIVRTSTISHPTGWRHLAVTYDQAAGSDQMKIYIDGVEKGATTTTSSIIDNALPLLIGTEYGTQYAGDKIGYFNGSLDEIRFSSVARSTFNLTPYTPDAQTIEADTPQLTSQIKSWSAFNTSETANGGTITYRLSIDGGTTWKYWNVSAWATSSNTTQANDRATINTNISTLAAGPGGIVWQAILDGDGNQLVTLNSVEVVGVADTTAPTNPTTLVPLSADGGVSITSDTWYAHTSPYFSWSGADDGTGSGVSGYYVYFGTDDTADPYLAGAFQVSPTYTGVGLVSGSTYYLRIKTKDTAQNVSSAIWDGAVSPAMFSYKYDGTSPSGLTINSPSPAGYAAVDNYTFTWSAATDTASSVNHYEFKTGASTGPYSTYQTTDTLTSQYITAASYQIGENIFYLKAIDNAGNESTPVTKSYYYAGAGPSQPQGLAVDPTTNTDCSFTFSWQPPATHSGNLTGSNLTYCYTVNNRPTSGLCNGKFTSEGVLSVPNYCNEDMRNDLNTFYVVARDPANVGSSVNYGAYAEISFTLNTTEPGVPANMEVSDISIKSDELWKLTVSWTEPELNGDRVSSYRIYRSEDDVTFTKIAETSGTAYVDTGLEQQIYYYKVAACDVVQNCGAQTESVGLLPTGKYTDSAALVSGPTASAITTKKATITWGTDRGSDSKVQYGTSPGSYFTEEPSNSTQITDHEITLNNLTPGTQYYFKTKWTDEDGNTGKSAEKSFTTEPAPNVKDVSARKVGINSAFIQFTSTGASKVKIYYGETSAFGNVKTISTSASETTADVELESLKDDVKHYYKVNAFDSDGVEYEGTTLSFLTLPRPLVKGVRVQQIAGTAQTIVLVSWSSNTPLSSIVTYFPTSNPSDAKDEVGVELIAGEHQIILRGLSPVTAYTLIVSGRDKAGNEARSDRQNFTTATDTRPPKISNVKIEGSTTKVSKGSTQKLAQFVISWTTDEPATSQVEFGEGTGTSYPQKTQEESQYKVNHLVVISNIPPSRVYHMRALSKDSTDNLASSPDLVTISARGSDDALELVTTNLLETFGFLKGVVGQ